MQVVSYGLDVDKSAALHREYMAAGGERLLWFVTCRMRMHTRHRDVARALALYEEGKPLVTGDASDSHFFGAAITACARVRRARSAICGSSSAIALPYAYA